MPATNFGTKVPTTNAVILGTGTNSAPETSSAASPNFLDFRVKNTAASGTARGLYLREYLSGGAGGEAIRAFTTVENNAPVDTVNGAHNSLSFGASAGNVTGLGTGSRNTLHVPNRSLGGTTTAVMAELYADGSSSALGGVTSALRAAFGGDATGAAAIEDSAYLLEIVGGSNASGNMVGAAGNEPTWTSKTHLIRVLLNGTVAYLVAVLP